MRKLFLLSVLALLAACSDATPGVPDDGDSGGPPGGGLRDVDLRLTAITVRGSFPDAEAITVRGVPDQDGVADTHYEVGFVLGGTGPTALPMDDGVAWSAEFPIARVGGDLMELDTVLVTVEP